jgi:uncharacterized protein YuzB (UPF0349 family)
VGVVIFLSEYLGLTYCDVCRIKVLSVLNDQLVFTDFYPEVSLSLQKSCVC